MPAKAEAISKLLDMSVAEKMGMSVGERAICVRLELILGAILELGGHFDE